MKIIYVYRRFIYWLFYELSPMHFQCDLCLRSTLWDNASSYYDDVLACSVCCPPGFRDPDSEVEQ